VLPADEQRREAASAEIARVISVYEDFCAGRSSARKWTVPGTAISDRMDVKATLPTSGRRTRRWRQAGFEVVELADLIQLAFIGQARADDVVDTSGSVATFTHQRVRYDGFAERGDEVVSGAKLDEHEGVRVRGHQFVNVLSCWWSLSVA
jgi:type I restriction enzyme M protein